MNPVTQPSGPGVAEWYAQQIREQQAEVARLQAEAEALRDEIKRQRLRAQVAEAEVARLQAVEEGSEG